MTFLGSVSIQNYLLWEIPINQFPRNFFFSERSTFHTTLIICFNEGYCIFFKVTSSYTKGGHLIEKKVAYLPLKSNWEVCSSQTTGAHDGTAKIYDLLAWSSLNSSFVHAWQRFRRRKRSKTIHGPMKTAATDAGLDGNDVLAMIKWRPPASLRQVNETRSPICLALPWLPCKRQGTCSSLTNTLIHFPGCACMSLRQNEKRERIWQVSSRTEAQTDRRGILPATLDNGSATRQSSIRWDCDFYFCFRRLLRWL